MCTNIYCKIITTAWFNLNMHWYCILYIKNSKTCFGDDRSSRAQLDSFCQRAFNIKKKHFKVKIVTVHARIIKTVNVTKRHNLTVNATKTNLEHTWGLAAR